MRNTWSVLFLALALGGALLWGYTRHTAANQLALRSENAYHQSFNRLEQMLADVEDVLARTQATASPRLQQRLLQDLRVSTAAAAENLAGLPLLHVKMERTEHFLNDVLDSADQYGFMLERGERLGAVQFSRLRELHSQAAYLRSEVGNLAGLVAGGRIRWADTERVTQAGMDGDARTPVLDGIGAIERGLAPPPGEQGAEAPTPSPRLRPRASLGAPITPAQALEIGGRFLDLPPGTAPVLAGRADGNVPVFLVQYTKTNGVPVTVAVTEQGGRVLEVLDGRPLGSPTLNREQAIERARAFLAKNGHAQVVPLLYDEYDEAGAVAVVTAVPVQDGLVIFHQKMKVRLARDNGEVIGYDAREFWMNQQPRRMPPPKLTAAEAAAHLAPNLQLQEVRLGVVDTEMGEERLAYRMEAALDGHRFEIYIDAMTAEEIKINRLEKEA